MTGIDNSLGNKIFTFAVISDTHVNSEEDSCNSPFPVNARANARFRYVVADLNRRAVDFVMHLGDVVHPVPETGALYGQAAEAYRDIVADLKMPIHLIPGNHDIGDLPFDGAPANPTTSQMIDAWSKEFGAQYQVVIKDDVRFLLLNAQLIGSGLADEVVQREWVEAELAARNMRTMLMLHHPPFLSAPDEPDHYDNMSPPGREWVLELLKKHSIEAMFAGHAHNFWYNRYETTDFYLASSTSFIRQDYSEMLRSTPPEGSEFGRDDRAKLGYFIINVYEQGHVMHFVRTYGAELAEGVSLKKVLDPSAPAPRENAKPLIGFDLRQNWAEISEVAPSGGLDEFDRKFVRNDYPLLALIEMGVRGIRIPMTDLRYPDRRARLGALQHLGFRPTLFTFGVPQGTDWALLRDNAALFEDWEMTVNWEDLGPQSEAIKRTHQETGLPVYISRMRTKADLEAGGVYFHVINHGFNPQDTAQLDQLGELRQKGIAGAVFRMSLKEQTEEFLRDTDMAVTSRGLLGSVHLRVAHDNPAQLHNDEAQTQTRVGIAMNTVQSLTSTRVFCDTLVDVDRGYFVRMGAIDRACNPRGLWSVVRDAQLGQRLAR